VDNKETAYSPMKQIIREAFLRSPAMIAESSHMSYPIPIFDEGKLRILFISAPAGPDPDIGMRLWSPDYKVVMDPIGAKLLEFTTITPRQFGLNYSPGKELEPATMPPGVDIDQMTMMEEQMNQELDLLLPLFEKKEYALNEKEQHSAHKWKRIFELFHEPAFRPYYLSAGKEFFAWIDKVTGN